MSNQMSERKASDALKIKKSTLNKRKNGIPKEKVGRPTVFSKEEETRFKAVLDCLARWRMAANVGDFQDMLQNYLNKLGRQRVKR